MVTFIASDHTGFLMKRYLIEKSWNNLIDLGSNDTESCDYPVFANNLVSKILETENSNGILICSTGIGMSISANRNKQIRAALCFNEEMAKMSRKHNNSNIIIFGASIISNGTALNCIEIFLKTEFDGGRHTRRLKLIDGGLQ